MEAITQRIALYHHLFLGCLIAAVICLVIAVTVFFLLDIREVIGYLSGSQRRKKVREMESASAQSGRLLKERSSMSYVAREMKQDMGVRQPAMPGARKVEHVVEEAPTAPMQQEIPTAPPQTMEAETPTDILKEPSGEMETSLLKTETAQTQESPPVEEREDGSTEVLGEAETRKGMFRIEREILLIHTEEVM